MKIINIAYEVAKRTDDLYKQSEAGKPAVDNSEWHKARTKAHAAVIAETECNVDPGYVRKVEHDTKTDRYTITFDDSERTYKI